MIPPVGLADIHRLGSGGPGGRGVALGGVALGGVALGGAVPPLRARMRPRGATVVSHAAAFAPGALLRREAAG